jgi:AhpD family alkylhydroperoxidase
MATVHLVEYEDASPAVRGVYDDIMATRQIDWINNFWKALAVQPELLRRTWSGVKTVTAPGALDPLVKEMLYIAVSVTNACQYCINSHTAAARKKGMTDEMLAELLALVGMACQTNALVTGLQVELDGVFKYGGRQPQNPPS